MCNFKTHLSVHSTIKRFQCSECTQQFHLKSRLYSDMKVHFPAMRGEKCLIPKHAENYFLLSQTFIVEINSLVQCAGQCILNRVRSIDTYIHKGIKPYQYNECGRQFSQKRTLANHVHAFNEKLYYCIQCNKRFSNKRGICTCLIC